MNNVEIIEVNYLRPNRTVETILLTDLSDSSRQKIVMFITMKAIITGFLIT